MQYLLLHTAAPDTAGPWGEEAWSALNSWLEETVSAQVNRAGDPLR